LSYRNFCKIFCCYLEKKTKDLIIRIVFVYYFCSDEFTRCILFIFLRYILTDYILEPAKRSVSLDRVKNSTPEFSFLLFFSVFRRIEKKREKTKNTYFLKSSLRLNNISFCITFSYCHISMLCFGNTIDLSMYDRKIFFVMHWEY
jgi:hypothetical protein